MVLLIVVIFILILGLDYLVIVGAKKCRSGKIRKEPLNINESEKELS